MCKLWPGGPFKFPCTDWVNELITIHIVCQPIRSLQVGPDIPDRPHVSVNQKMYFSCNLCQELEKKLTNASCDSLPRCTCEI